MLRVLDLGEGAARLPVGVRDILVRLAQRCPEQAGILGLAPGHAVVAVGADEALHDIEHMRLAFVIGAGAGDVARLGVGFRRRHGEVGLHAVAGEEGDQIRLVAHGNAGRDVPAAILRVPHGRDMRRRLDRMAAGLAIQRRVAHHP